MSMTLWWIADAALLLVVFPAITFLLIRIITPLMVGHRALLSIARSSRAITSELPTGMTELSATARTAATVYPNDHAAV